MTATIPAVATHWSRDHRPMVRTMANVSGDLGALMNYANAVGISPEVYPFPLVRRFLDRAEAWNQLGWEGHGQAEQAVKAARDQALESEYADAETLAAYVEELDRARVWLSTAGETINPLPGLSQEGMAPVSLGMGAAGALAQAERWRAGSLLTAATMPLYERFGQVAARAVERVAAVLPLPAAAWAAVEPVTVLPADTLAVLQEGERTLNLCHAAGLYLRAMGLQGGDVLQGDEPAFALTFRRWAEASAHLADLRTIRAPLKLPYAIEHGWEPGLWTAADVRQVDQGKARRKYVPAFMVKQG